MRVVREPLVAFHVSEDNLVPEGLAAGDVILVEPAGPSGYRDSWLATAFTPRAALMSHEFVNCVVLVASVVGRTEEIGTYDGEVSFGSDGAFSFVFQMLGRTLALPQEKRSAH